MNRFAVIAMVMLVAAACSDDPGLARQVDAPPPTPTLIVDNGSREEIPRELADELTRDILDAYAEPRSDAAERLGPAADYIDAPVTAFDAGRGREILELLVSGDEPAVRGVLTGPLLEASAELAAAFAGLDAELTFAGGVLPLTPDGAAALVELSIDGDTELHNVGFRFVDGDWFLETFR